MKSLNVAEKDYIDFAKAMKKTNTPFLTSQILGDNAYCIRYRDSDSEKVEMAIKQFEASRSLTTEMSPDKFSEKYAGRGVYSIDGISLVELELVRYYAVKRDFEFAVAATGDGSTCKIYFNDRKKMDAVLRDMAWQLTGERGPLVKEQIEYRLAGRETSRAIMESKDAEIEYYIASKTVPENYLRITQEAVERYQSGRLSGSIQRSDADWYDRTISALTQIEEPVALTKEEWESDQRENILQNRLEVIPTGMSAAERLVQEASAKEQRAREVYDLKISLDNSYSLKINNPMTDHTISYTQFFETECINDRHEEAIAHAAEAAEYLSNKQVEVREEYSERQREDRDESLRREAQSMDDTIPYGTDMRRL